MGTPTRCGHEVGRRSQLESKFPYETVSLWAICMAFPKYLNNLIRSEMWLNEGIFSRIINVLALPLFGAYSNAIIVDFYSQMKRLRLRIFMGNVRQLHSAIWTYFSGKFYFLFYSLRKLNWQLRCLKNLKFSNSSPDTSNHPRKFYSDSMPFWVKLRN